MWKSIISVRLGVKCANYHKGADVANHIPSSNLFLMTTRMKSILSSTE